MKIDLRKIKSEIFNDLLIEPVLNRKDQPSQTETKHINSVAPFSQPVIGQPTGQPAGMNFHLGKNVREQHRY